jgi:DNA-binding response OmpR family regulator
MLATKDTPHILIVEDDAETSRLFALALKSEGYTVTQATTVKQSVELLEQQAFSLVLVDWYLPDGTAACVCEGAQRMNRHTPIIMVSGHADLRTIQVENCQVNLWMRKPIDSMKLLSSIAHLLGQQ